MNRTELQERLDTIQKEAEEIKKALNQEAIPGDLLEDGCVVIQKLNGGILIAAPNITTKYCKWGDFFNVYDTLTQKGFTSCQWFIPTIEQLELAFTVAKDQFLAPIYWSSTVVNSNTAKVLDFRDGCRYAYAKHLYNLNVRAFRFVSF